MPGTTPFAAQASMALRMYLADKLAADKTIDLAPIMRGVSARTWAADKKRIAADISKGMKGRLAADASIADLPQKLDTLDAPAEQMRPEEKPPVRDSVEEKKAEIEQMLSGKLSPEEIAAIIAILDDQDLEEQPPPSPEPDPGADRGRMRDAAPVIAPRSRDGISEGVTTNDPSKPMPIDRRAMDAAIARAVRDAEQRTIQRMQDLADARNAVRSVVGDMAMDAKQTPADIYKYALDQMGVEIDGVPPEAFAALFRNVSKERARIAEMQPHHSNNDVPGAFDSNALASISKRFPGIHTRQG